MTGPSERDFHHPYQPYAIQNDFMNALYDCIEERKVGIFESPTGTGKSLSIICGSLAWLRESKRRKFEDSVSTLPGDEDEPDWIVEHAKEQKRRDALRARADFEKRLRRIREKERRQKKQSAQEGHRPKRQKLADRPDASSEGDAQYELADYDSDDANSRRPDASISLSAETRALMEKMGLSTSAAAQGDSLDVEDELKIYYCSRTHSQLSQFAEEIQKVKLPPLVPQESADDQSGETDLEDSLKYLTLGSRKNLCINPKVNRLKDVTTINERCLELQQSGTLEQNRCSFLPSKQSEHLLNDFRDHAFAQVRTIEGLSSLGSDIGVCPYYASRQSILPSEVVTLPYPLLLQKSAREALNISLRDHIVIIDEAHNLMEAINSIYSVSVTLEQVERSREQVGVYLQRFRTRLKGKNRVYVAQVVRLLDSLGEYLRGKLAEPPNTEGIASYDGIMAGKAVDQINLYKLSVYLNESKLARKIDGYTEYRSQEEALRSVATKPNRTGSVPSLMAIHSFFNALTNPSREGRFFYHRGEGRSIALQYRLLDPTFHFKEIVEDARAVILAGGTMSPMEDYFHHLFSYVDPGRISTFSCGHVIPASNIAAWPLVQTATESDFDFTFSKRNSDEQIRLLGETLISITSTIPDGTVVFFPSYAYLDLCLLKWRQSGSNVFHRLSSLKPVFFESRVAHTQFPTSGETDKTVVNESILASYAQAIRTPSTPHRGAILLSVIGGNLSEGINFSDELGRCVVVVGLPFPNPHSAEWKAKMAYVSSKTTASRTATGDSLRAAGDAGKAASREFYENATMRAVNQAIGRAIRHRGDYATIVLMDKRYGAERIRTKLPNWIRESLRGASHTGQVIDGIKGFFREKGP